MKLVRATDLNNDQLIEYFENTILPGPIDFQLKRIFNFFNQYKIQTDDYVTYTLLNDDSEIEAMVSLIFRKGFIDASQLEALAQPFLKSGYGEYLLKIIDEKVF